MKSIYFFIICLCVLCSSQAQQIFVFNNLTNEVIPGVAIYNEDKTKSTTTDIDGVTNLDGFDDSETIYFQHISYILKSFKKSELSNLFTVHLDPNTQGLDEIIISASKFEQNKRDIPQKIVSVKAKDIQFSNPQTSADVLEGAGQIYIQKSQLGGGSPMIRGFSTNRLLITVDGVRMNNAIFRGGNIQNVISIDPFSIKSTEITLGAGSVIYGSDAIGGVMSFYTHKPKLSKSDSLLFNSSMVARYASASQEKTGHLNLNFGLKKWGFLTNVSYTSFEDLKMGKHGPKDYLRPEYVSTINGTDAIIANNEPRVQKFSGYDQINLMQKIRYEVSNTLSYNLGLFYTSTTDNPRYDRLIRYDNNQLRYAEWNYGPQKWFMGNFNITKLSSSSNLYDKINATIAFQNFQESRISRDLQSPIRTTRKEQVNAFSFNSDFEKALSTKTKLFYGVEYIYNKVGSKANQENLETQISNPTVTRYPNGASWQSIAAYTSIKYKPNPNFVFQSGIRFNHVAYKANFRENNEFLNLPFDATKSNSGALTGTAGISWSPSKLIQWKVNASSAFRAPNIDDVGKVFDSEPGSVVVPNQNLKPEYAYGGEVGLKLNINDHVTLDLSTYYTYLDNALVRADYNLNGETQILYDGEVSNVQAVQNASKAWIYGLEAGLRINFTKQIQLNSQYNIIGGTEEDNNIEVPIRHVSPNFGNTHLIYTSKKLKLDLFANYNNELSFNQLAPSEVEKDYLYASDKNGNPYAPSWYTLNSRVQYQILDSTSISLSLENITNQRYKTYSSGIAAPGRNFIIALQYEL